LLLLLLPAAGGAGEFRRGVQVELVSTVEGLTELAFKINDVTLSAEQLPRGARPGPTVKVFSSPSKLEIEGTWRVAGTECSWRGTVAAKRGETLLLELGEGPDAVHVVRAVP